MLRVAIQVKELISSNVTSVIDAASNPAKMLHRLQREIEESIIALQRERTLADRRKTRLKTELTQAEMREAGWSDKAKTAMDHDREDLARQALMAREDCTATIAKIKDDLDACARDLIEIDQAITDLEEKHEETRTQARDQMTADAQNAPAGTPDTAGCKADAHMGRISELEKRTAFATQDTAEKRTHASTDKEIEEMRRASKIDAELAAMKKAPAKKTPAKKTTSKKIA